jgi:UTP:GlnB (protein PII) uridylyltransferase
VARYLVRIRLLDRPGALGLVASRIGSAGGDIVAIDIIERVEGEAVDEFVIELAGDELVEPLRRAVHDVDGALVEAVRSLEPPTAWESGQPDVDED